ncbi:hypothetical protein C4553_01320 [Candidatus Parcubacteria bacterium]|nr:MAG: hypothetical protein C4553_01320 [Candidatus Parcubacteria bacterium]
MTKLAKFFLLLLILTVVAGLVGWQQYVVPVKDSLHFYQTQLRNEQCLRLAQFRLVEAYAANPARLPSGVFDENAYVVELPWGSRYTYSQLQEEAYAPFLRDKSRPWPLVKDNQGNVAVSPQSSKQEFGVNQGIFPRSDSNGLRQGKVYPTLNDVPEELRAKAVYLTNLGWFVP